MLSRRLPTKETQRNALMVYYRRKGQTLSAVGKVFGVGTERVRQIVAKHDRTCINQSRAVHQVARIWDTTSAPAPLPAEAPEWAKERDLRAEILRHARMKELADHNLAIDAKWEQDRITYQQWVAKRTAEVLQLLEEQEASHSSAS